MRRPSVKTLARAFPECAKALRDVLVMTRAELEATDVGGARVRECYHPPKTYDVRMCVLNAVAKTYGVEGAQTTAGEWLTYLNTGETYTPTICFWRGKYRVQSWGDFVETSERRNIHF